MKKSILLLFICLGALSLYSQEKPTPVNNGQTTDIFGAQVGVLGAWIHYEKSLDKNFTIDGSLGYTGGLLKGTDNKLGYIFTTKISVEPRYYYNIEKRFKQGKKTMNNSANFLALDLSYIPDWGTSANKGNVGVDQSFAVIPKYGLRRALSHNIDFHFAFGIGYQWNNENTDGVAVGLDLKLGLNFL